MVGDARSGDAADVPAEVVALGPVRGGQRFDALRTEAMDLERFRVVEVAEVRLVPIRRDEQMAGRVGELVQQHEGANFVPA